MGPERPALKKPGGVCAGSCADSTGFPYDRENDFLFNRGSIFCYDFFQQEVIFSVCAQGHETVQPSPEESSSGTGKQAAGKRA